MPSPQTNSKKKLTISSGDQAEYRKCSFVCRRSKILGKGKFRSVGTKILAKVREKTKGRQLKGKIVSEFFTLFRKFSHIFRSCPRTFPFKTKVANPPAPYSIQKCPEPQVCQKFVPTIVFSGFQSGGPKYVKHLSNIWKFVRKLSF